MTTGMSTPPPLPTSTPANRLVDERLARIGNTVKVSDIGSGLMVWLSGLFALVMLWVLIDHWIVGLPIWGRFVGLISLVAWTAFSWVRWVMPHIFRRINPAYAAQVAERANPNLRNRLLNFVLLRGERERLREPVYRELEAQAHRQARQIDTEEAVDRSGLVRISTVAAALFVVFGLYTAISPKSPLATLGRLLAPWKTIARPARVHIDDVRPGSTTVYAGQLLEVSAMVDKVSDDDSVWLVYSSVDQQIVDQRVLMKRDESSGRYSATLPKARKSSTGNSTTSSRTGIRAHLDYRIEVSDAVAGPFRVTVSPKPSLVVDRVEYDFPEYTQLPDETVDGLGDIKALEGTRVRIFATANQPIESAYLEFDPDGGSAKRRTIRMQHDGLTASVSFRLRLEPDRRTQLHRAYQLRFTNVEHEINDRPILHQIDIDPDLPPIVEILRPEMRITDVPLNGAQLLEIRGLDPDFGLANMTLHGVARGRELFTPRSLLNETAAGQVVQRLTFRPQKFDLVEGDVVEVWASAFDNRFDVFEETAAPNMARNTPRYTLRVVAPVAQPTESEGSSAEGEEGGDGQAGDEGASAGDGEEGGSGGAGESGSKSDPNSQQGSSGERGESDDEGSQSSGGDSSDGESGESGESGQAGDSGQAGEPEGGGQGESGEAGSGQSGESGESGGDSGGGQQGEGGQQGGDESGGDGMSPSGDRSDPSQENGERGGQEDGSGQPGENGRGQDQSSREAQGDSNGAADPANRGQRDSANYDADEPVPSDGSSDGDAFERVLDRMRELNGERSDGTPKSDPGESDDPTDAGDSENERGADDVGGEDESNGERAGDSAGENAEGGEGSSGDASQDSEESGAGGRAGESQEGSQQGDGQSSEQSDPAGDRNGNGDAGERPGQNEDGMSNDSSSGDSSQGSSGSEQSDSSDDGNSGEGGSSHGEQGESTENGEAGESEANGATDGQSSSNGSGEPSADGSGGSGESGEGSQPGQESGQDGATGDGESGESGSSANGEPSAGDSSPSTPGEANGESAEGGESGEDSPVEENGENASPPESGSESGGSMQGGSNAAGEGSESDSGSSGGSTGGSSGGQPVGGGQSVSGDISKGDDDGSMNDSPDAANLEYTKKATDLALEYLKDQRDNPDPELLDRLGWTERELKQFLNRWESLQKTARQPKRGEADPEDFNDALRSLGLHPDRDRLRRGGLDDDQVQGVQDGGVRTKPPAEYDSLYREFMRRRGKRSPSGSSAGSKE